MVAAAHFNSLDMWSTDTERQRLWIKLWLSSSLELAGIKRRTTDHEVFVEVVDD
jgi:hypothetical protein